MSDTSSNSKKVLDEVREEQCLIDEHSATGKLVAEQVKKIVQRLMKAQDEDFDINQFEFMLMDTNDANAFFLNKEHTPGKHVIAVSSGLIKICESEAEFAAVLGHELGHFTKSQTLDNQKNTVFEERGSDLWSVHLLENAGYDPRAIRSIYAKILGKTSNNLIQSILQASDVHGSNRTRLEDVDMALAYIKQKKGELKENAEDNWAAFQENFTAVFPQDRYVSYLDKVFLEKCKSAKLEITENNIAMVQNVPPEELYTILLDEIKQGNINNASRYHRLYNVLQSINPDSPDTNRSLYEEKTQEIIEAFYEDTLKKTGLPTLDRFSEDDELRSLTEMLALRRRKEFRPFGQFQKVNQAITDFIAAKTPEEALQAISTIEEQEPVYAQKYRNYIDFNNFAIYDEKEAVGKEIPWNKHKKWAADNPKIATFMANVFSDDVTGNYICALRFPYLIATDRRNIIIAVDEEAKNILRERQNRKRRLSQLLTARMNRQRFREAVEHMNVYADYATGKISAQELLEHGLKRPDINGLIAEDFLAIPYDDRMEIDPYGKQNLDFLRASPAYHTFIKGNTWLERAVYADLLNKLETGHQATYKTLISSLCSVYHNDQLLKKIGDLHLQMCKELNLQEIYALPIEPKDFSGFKLLKTLDEKNVLSPEEKETITAGLREAEKDLTDWHKNMKLSINAYNIEHTVNLVDCVYKLKAEIGKEIMEGKETPLLDAIESRRKISSAKDMEKFSNNFLNGLLTWKYMRTPEAEKVSLNQMLSMLQSFHQKSDDETQEIVNQDLSRYIERHQLFPTGTFEKDFELYVQMSNYGFFSAEYANREKFVDRMVADIEKMPDEQKETAAFALLTQSLYYQRPLYVTEKSLPFPPAKEKLMEMWVDCVFNRLGKDDGSEEYFEKIRSMVTKLKADINSGRPLMAPLDRSKLIRKLSDKIVSKQKLSAFFEDTARPKISGKDLTENDILGRTAEGALVALTQSPELCDETIQFLNRRLTPKSVKDFKQKLQGMSARFPLVAKKVSTESLEILHKTFWSEGLEVRAVVMNKLLNRYSDNLDTQIEYVCDLHFAKDDPYRKDADLIFKTVIQNFEPFERGLILSAIASANENRDDEHKNGANSVGKGLTMFFENMGPAWVKFGQLLSYVPDLPSEIRKDLATLKDKADIPPRWEIYRSIRETLPQELQDRIGDVGKILGAGSFWITTQVQLRNQQTGEYEDKVLSLLRPSAAAKFAAGDKVILQSVAELGQADSKYQQLNKIAEQASISGKLESDVVYGYEQLKRAKDIYAGLSVTVEGTEIKPEVADWLHYGTGKDGMAYKIMDMAKGASITSKTHSEEERRKMAIGYTTIELVNLLRGKVWDTDRHSGQQNFARDGMERFIVGIFDTGAQMQKAPDRKDKIMLGEFLFGMTEAARKGKDLNSYMFNKIKQMDKLNRLNIDTGYIAGVQRGLTALSDIMEYQKEIKDKDGNIIQERKSLNGKDLEHIAKAIMEAGLMDKTVRNTMTMRALVTAFNPVKTGGMAEMIFNAVRKSPDTNPVGIRYEEQFGESRGQEQNKSFEEIRGIIREKQKASTLGVDHRYLAEKTAVTEGSYRQVALAGFAPRGR